MHPVELETALSNMQILVDTREQKTTRAIQRYASFGVPWQFEKLDFGDYSAVFSLYGKFVLDLRHIAVIERKMSLDELCNCYTRDRKRFEQEFQKAKICGAKIYLLIENGSFKKAYKGVYYSRMKPQALIASIFAWLARYNCQIIMAEEDLSGRIIKEILYREAKEILQTLDFSKQI